MGDLYDNDVVAWSERQADLLRRVAAGERINDLVDWPNVIEEVESVGQSQVDAVESLWTQAFLHDLKAEAWPPRSTWTSGAPTRGCSGARPGANTARQCGRSLIWPASMPTRSQACPTRWTARRRCRCRRLAR